MAARKKSSGCGCAALGILVALAAFGVYLYNTRIASGPGVPIYLSASQLQTGLAQAFPLDKRELFLSVHLSDPTVDLHSVEGDRIGFGSAVGVSMAGRKVANGRVTADGKLRYEPSNGTFYLDDPEIKSLDIERVSGAEAGPIRKAVTYLLKNAVRHLAVYKLDTNDVAQRYAKRAIKSVRVHDGSLEVRLGLNP